MFFSALVLLGLMGTVTSTPIHPCPKACVQVEHYDQQYIKQVSDLGDSSVAPWTLEIGSHSDDSFNSVPHAVCKKCTVDDMIAKPIYLQISVFKRAHDNNTWCRCPHNLAVGCTCVKKPTSRV